ncbi:MAG: mechanosensitive ion channel domain-containing protein [Candidatus Omnitrophota bacterium]
MKTPFNFNKIIMWSVVIGLTCIQVQRVYADEVSESPSAETVTNSTHTTSPKEAPKENSDLIAALVTDKEAVERIETKHAETTDKIEKAAKEVDETKLEAQHLVEEKKVMEKQAEAKAQEATAVKEEAKVILTEAIKTGDVEAKQKAQKMSQEAQKLKQEAHVQEEKAKALELKAQASEQKVSADVAAIEAMKKDLEDLRKEKHSRRGLIDKAIHGGVIVLGGLFLLWLLRFAVKHLHSFVSEKDAIRESGKTLRIKTLAALLKWAGSLIILSIAVYMFLENFGVDMTPFLAGAGIIGLAFGFGGQYLIRDIINGIFILVEGQYRINDVVKIGETGGLVENVNLRITKLRDLEGRVIYIPNGEVKTVINFTQEYAQALLDIGVAYKENVDHVIAVIKDVAKTLREDQHFSKLIMDDLEMLGVDDFADSQVTIKCRFKTLPIKQWEVAREFRRRLKNKFDELGIEIPFPHRTLYWGTGADNQWLKDALGKRDGRMGEGVE